MQKRHKCGYKVILKSWTNWDIGRQVGHIVVDDDSEATMGAILQNCPKCGVRITRRGLVSESQWVAEHGKES